MITISFRAILQHQNVNQSYLVWLCACLLTSDYSGMWMGFTLLSSLVLSLSASSLSRRLSPSSLVMSSNLNIQNPVSYTYQLTRFISPPQHAAFSFYTCARHKAAALAVRAAVTQLLIVVQLKMKSGSLSSSSCSSSFIRSRSLRRHSN